MADAILSFGSGMGKILLGSILIAPFVIARYGASVKNPRRGGRRVAVLAIAFNLLYTLSVIYVYFKLA